MHERNVDRHLKREFYSVIDTWLLYGATGYQSIKSNVGFCNGNRLNCKYLRASKGIDRAKTL